VIRAGGFSFHSPSSSIPEEREAPSETDGP
jgi:hypothetical protein